MQTSEVHIRRCSFFQYRSASKSKSWNRIPISERIRSKLTRHNFSRQSIIERCSEVGENLTKELKSGERDNEERRLKNKRHDRDKSVLQELGRREGKQESHHRLSCHHVGQQHPLQSHVSSFQLPNRHFERPSDARSPTIEPLIGKSPLRYPSRTIFWCQFIINYHN